MAEMKAPERTAFQRQPARVLLLDLRSPMDSYTRLNVQEALSAAINLIHYVDGAPRLTHFGLMILGVYPDCILPLQPIRSNLHRVQAALSELKSAGLETSVRTNSRGCVLEGIQKALEQFQRVTQNTKQNPGTPSQIEITLVTCQDGESVYRLVVGSVDQLNVEHLRKITAVCVTDPNRVLGQTSLDGKASGDSEWESNLRSSQTDLANSPANFGMSVVDVVTVDNDSMSLCNTFKQWLLDCSTDSEHVHIKLPGDTSLVLKCDLQDRVINPLNIPSVGDHFVLKSGNMSFRQ